jgi:hypothetical protein
VPPEMRELYRSSNGDRWLLARDRNSGHVFVQHEPNPGLGRPHVANRDRHFFECRSRPRATGADAPDWNPGRGAGRYPEDPEGEERPT